MLLMQTRHCQKPTGIKHPFFTSYAFWCRYKEVEKSHKRFLELKQKNAAAEKELSQLSQAQSSLDSAVSLFDSGEFTKALEHITKVVLVFSPACSKCHAFGVSCRVSPSKTPVQPCAPRLGIH